MGGVKLLLVAQGDGGAGLCFVSANEKFCANSCVFVLTPKINMINKFNGIFIATIISKNKNNFNHEKGININYLRNLKIKLPITKDGNPDWIYMEEFIKSKFIKFKKIKG